MSRAHAVYSMSSASTWLTCTASARLCATVPADEGEEYTHRGTAAHELLEYLLSTNEPTAEFCDGIPMSNGICLTKADCEAVQVALDYIYELAAMDPDATIRTESRVVFAPNPEHCYGTCDVIVTLPNLGLIYIIDYKHGEGKIVEVEENDQTLGYGVAAITTHKLDPAASYTLVIIQPRAHHKDGPIREWSVSRERLEMQSLLMQHAIAEGESDSPVYAPSEDRCRWCAAATVCPAAEREGLKAFGIESYKQADTMNLPDIETLDPARLAYMLSALDFLKALQKNAYARAMSLARAGVYIPGWKLAEARAMRRYEHDTDTTLALIVEMTNGEIPLDEIAPRTVIGITEMEATLKRHFRSKKTGRKAQNEASETASLLFADLTTKDTSGTLSLVRETDHRPAVNPTSAVTRIVAMPPPA